jgi:hypothetical protein
MLKIVCAIVISAVAAACIVAFPRLSPQTEAVSLVTGTKADRADVRPFGADCTQKAWPYFEGACLRQAKSPLVQSRDVRVVDEADPRAAR